ncbi:glycosyl transferase family 1 [Arachidicoccus ginsenosidimutans]|uniref:DUF1972 domain-containing protein n=1 Tax=Arachidicoccus sp. BS20 TaxID=1850526 RepID=UPI0007F14E78|nr:DUF1972 domain-containing protein [Arachidicoccus sp. BS20]ANI88446.1 glycosyl transferase family 1 [Arachidicoccus sp. BS20]
MNIAIIGTRGIPNNYGGFEQFAEYLSVGLVNLGYTVTVYNSHKHPFKGSNWNGVNIVHCFDPEHLIGTVGQFVYDFNCIVDTRHQEYDIILQLGYTSSSVWGRLLPKRKSVITTNMDGFEWKRSKYSKVVRRFLLYAESLAVKHSHYLISDSIGIQKYISNKYNAKTEYIPYGAHIFDEPEELILKEYDVEKYGYNMLVARLEKENNIETILDGTLLAASKTTFLVVGNCETKYGKYLKEKYAPFKFIRFMDSIYDIDRLNNLRYFSNIYFHGHSVGGTNPSLIEAMASQTLICAHDNVFNKTILGKDAYYFSDAEDVANTLNRVSKNNNREMIRGNIAKVINHYSWENIVHQYLEHFEQILFEKQHKCVLAL